MKRQNFLKWFLVCLAAASLVWGCSSPEKGAALAPAPAAQAGQADGLLVHFIDVGQGDSILIQSGGRSMLVDAGENDQGEIVVSYLKSQGVSSLDYVIGTHPHSDHIGGLDTVIESFNVRDVILPPAEHTTKTFEDVVDAVADKGLSVTEPKPGDRYEIGDASFTILAPNGDYGDDLNNWSVGLRLEYGQNHFVMCGDAEEGAEADICANGLELSADVLKAGHHGSRTSTSEAFLDKVNPKTVVIQCGEGNSYGHPHQETLDKLSARGIQVFRTDLDGTVVAHCDGASITWSTEADGAVDGNSGSEAAQGGGNGADLDEMADGGSSGAAQAAVSGGLDGAESPATVPAEESSLAGAAPAESAEASYVLNTNSKKFHLPGCPSVGKMKESNRQDYTGSREDLIGQGYSPCGQCNP